MKFNVSPDCFGWKPIVHRNFFERLDVYSVFGIVMDNFNIVKDNFQIETDNFGIATDSLFRSIENLNDYSSFRCGTVDCERIGSVASGAAIERGNLLAFELS
jgi:hypothetical protein